MTRPGFIQTLVVVALIAMFVGVFWFSQRTPANDIAWVTDYEAARQTAADRGKPMLLYFTADWCPPCKQMKREVWPRADVAEAVNGQVVPVYVDTDKQRALAQRYGVESIPTMMFVAADGELLTNAAPQRVVGYQSAERLIDMARQAGRLTAGQR